MSRLTEAAQVHPTSSVQSSTLGRYVEIGRNSSILQSEVGDYSYCTDGCDIANARIGKFSNIASAVRIGATDHPLNTASLHHFLYRSGDYWDDAERDEAWFAKRRARIATVGHDTWLGHACQIKPEVNVGHGAVVASGAIVTKDVAPYTIVAGVPAKVLRLRQPPEVAERLIALAWWDWSHTDLRAALEDFRTLDALDFLDRYEP